MASRLATVAAALVAGVLVGGARAQVYTASGLPIAIPDSPTITSTISITGGPASVTQLELVLRLDHATLNHLDFFLVRGSKYLHLSTDNGALNDNFANLRLRDGAYRFVGAIPSSIGNNIVGDYRPEGGSISLSSGATFSLAGLTRTASFAELISGESADGNWTLVIDDDTNGITGQLNYWSLEFNGAVDPTGPTNLPLPPAFTGDFTSTPNTLVFGTPTTGTTEWNGPTGAQPGLTDGAGEDFSTGYANNSSLQDFPGAEVAYRFDHTGGPIAFKCSSAFGAGLIVIDSTGTPAGALKVAADSFTGIEVATFQNLAAGTYYVVVDGVSNQSNGGSFTIETGIPPTNDECTSAATITTGASVAFDTSFSSSDGFNASNCFGTAASPDIYFSYTPTAAGVATFSTCDATFDAVLSVQNSCTADPTRCSSTGCAVTPTLPELKVCTQPGVPVIIRVGGFFDVVGSGTLSVTFTPGTGSYAAPSGTPEGEPCRDDPLSSDAVNGGCESDFVLPVYTTAIAPGQTIVGISSQDIDNGVTDYDYYTFTLAANADVTVSGQAEFDAFVSIISDPADCSNANTVGDVVSTASPCLPDFTLTRSLTAGTYAIRVVPADAPNLCSDPGNGYWVRLNVAAPCPADFDGLNGVDVQDIFAFLNAWFAGDVNADFDGLNGVDVQDIFAFLNAWFAGCP